MGGLAHYFEVEGIATTQISLIREHTQKIRPPRALWVPFELGRPFGPPDDPAFQRRVLIAALALLDRERGPVLEDFPEDVPASTGELSGWACPISFDRPQVALSGTAAIEQALNDEIAQLAPWYDLALERRKRTTVGASGLELSAIAKLYAAMLVGPLPERPIADVPLPTVMHLSAEDLKAYYLEAASAQPGEASAQQLGDWFWQQTHAGDVLRRLRARCIASGDKDLQFVGSVLMVPAHQG